MAKHRVLDDCSESSQVEAIARSQIFLDYQRAFVEGTGLPLSLHGPQMMKLVRYPKRHANPFCALMGQASGACAACYALQLQLEKEARPEMKTLRCFAGLCESAVPVRLAENLIAFLHTGQVLLQPLSRSQFNRVARRP
jgi:ligand-binding sensor protein